jgi:6-phosphogluconolactonase/glucosamine-6-phosphate isomerase/deaminase
MDQEVHESVDAVSLAAAAATYIAVQARQHIAEHGAFRLALSGGVTAEPLLFELAQRDVPWNEVTIFQVDERVAPDGDAARNATSLVASLGDVGARLELMDVTSDDLVGAASRYAQRVPARFDLVHLGLGDDGHTASLSTVDPDPGAHDELVVLTGEFRGYRRMTLTLGALARADQLVWVVSGHAKHDILSRFLGHDASLVATHVVAARSVVMADRAALQQ